MRIFRGKRKIHGETARINTNTHTHTHQDQGVNTTKKNEKQNRLGTWSGPMAEPQ